jgi:hypothetical protein
VTLNPDPANPVEVALRRYEDQAAPFYAKWTGMWPEVEADRAAFQAACDAGRWTEAVAARQQRWCQRSDSHGVPYGDLAPRRRKPKSKPEAA